MDFISKLVHNQPEVKFYNANQRYFELTRLTLYVKENPQPNMVEVAAECEAQVSSNEPGRIRVMTRDKHLHSPEQH